ncbi:MAG: IS21 family transposase [Eubacteriales bacterium]|nr:IS21 family transposase [Eubacteriales bacterium]
MLDYKSIITKHFRLHMSGADIARQLGVSKSGVNDFLREFKKSDKISYPVPESITNYGIHELVYGHAPGSNARNELFAYPDFESVFRQMEERKNMTLVFLWNRYQKDCEGSGLKAYQYRQFCELYAKWCEENYETIHLQAVIGQKMEVDFAGQTFDLVDKLTGEITTIVVFVAVLPYSQMIYAEGMTSSKEPQWIDVNNHAIRYFGGVPSIVVCDNCKQAVIANKDWIEPDLNKDYAAWADHNHTAILPAKVRKPKYKSSVENSVGILEKGFFHELEEMTWFSLEQFNEALWEKLDKLNHQNFSKKDCSRYDMWIDEQKELMPLPSTYYQYMERKTAKVSGDFHVRFDNAYYSVDKAFLHKNVTIGATSDTVNIYSMSGSLIKSWPRASHRGKWMTDPDHLPEKFREMSEWNSTYFIKRAMTVGPNTVNVIEHVLKSREHEVQTYRLCLGILNFTKKYSKLALEDCCKAAINTNHISYSFIKNTIASVAEEIGSSGYNTRINEERNKGAFVMDSHAGDISNLLSRSSHLADQKRKEAGHED